MKKEIGSHKYISKVVLRGFSFEDNKGDRYVKAIHFPGKRIHHRNIKTFNTEKNAYTLKNEMILNCEFENALGPLQKRIGLVMKGKGKRLPGDALFKDDFDDGLMRTYFAYQCIRDDMAIKKMIKIGSEDSELDLLRMINIDKNGPISSIKNQLISQESRIKVFKRAFEDMSMVIGISAGGDLLGSNYIVNLSEDDESQTFGLAISKHIMIILTDNYASRDAIVLKYVGFSWKILRTEQEDFINYRTIIIGKQRGEGYVVSDSEERIKKYLDLRLDT